MSISDRLDQIEQRAEAATEGPWEARGLDYNTCVGRVGKYQNLARLGDPLDRETWRNAKFIAAARTDVPALVAALRAVLDLCDEAADPPGISGFEVGMAAMSQKVRTAIETALEGDL